MFSVGALGVVQMEVWTHILKCVILVSVWKQTVLLAIKILPSHSHQCCNSYSFHPKCSMCFMSSPCPKYATLSHLWLVFITTVSFQIRSYEFVKVGTQIHAENSWCFLFHYRLMHIFLCLNRASDGPVMLKFSKYLACLNSLLWHSSSRSLIGCGSSLVSTQPIPISIPSLMLFAQSID